MLENAALNADSDSLVEERVEHVVADIDGVVGLDIFLQGWTAVEHVSGQSKLHEGVVMSVEYGWGMKKKVRPW